MTPEERAIAIAARIADGSAIDWPDATSVPPDSAAPSTLAELKTIAALAALHRAPDGWEDDGAPAAGSRWGTLVLVGKIGEGRFGDVYRAWEPRLQRQVALKLLRASPRTSATSSSHAIEEARLLARVRHPNVLTVHGAEIVDGQIGIWTEFIEGRTLDAIVTERGPLPADEVVAIGIDLCRALAAVHAAGLLHRDVKAQNVMRETGGRIVLMDFGTGQDLDVIPARAGDFSGTPLYLAPEIFAGGAPSVASDVYAVAVLLFYALTGQYPATGQTLDEVRRRHEAGDRRQLEQLRPDVPEGLAEAIERGLADPLARYRAANEFEAALVPALITATAPSVDAPLSSVRSWRAWTRPAGVLAVALLLAVAVPFVARRLSHEGTPAPLLLKAKDLVLVGAFDNRTGDPTLDGSVEAALEHELTNSQFVTVAGPDRVANALRLMLQRDDVELTPAVAREVCLRDGAIRAFVTGRIERAGSAYELSAKVTTPQDAFVLSDVRASADGRPTLMAAIRRLSSDVRERLGEPHEAVLRSNQQLEQVTTPSLRAAQLYTQAFHLGSLGHWAASADLADEAVAEDPEFASAHTWLGWSLQNRPGPDRDGALIHITRGFELADRATERERFFIRGSYFGHMGDPAQAVAEYKALLMLYPDDYWAAYNLGVESNKLPRADAAAVFKAHLVDRWPNSPRARLYAAQQAVHDGGDSSSVLTAIDRARALASNGSDEMQWLTLAPAFIAWADADPARAVSALEQSTRASLGLGDPDALSLQAGLLSLSLGRTEVAQYLFNEMAVGREPYLALLALARNDASAVGRWAAVETSGTDWGLRSWVLARADQFDELLRIDATRPSTPRGATRLDVEMAHGATATAAALARQSLGMTRGDPSSQPNLGAAGRMAGTRGAEVAARALLADDDFTGAIAVLEASGRGRRATFQEYPNGYYWLRTQALLADVYRRVGRSSDANDIETDLRKVLALADPDFDLGTRLRAGVHPLLSPEVRRDLRAPKPSR